VISELILLQLSAVEITDQGLTPPAVVSVEGTAGAGFDRLLVAFSEGVYTGTGRSGQLVPGDFTLNDDNGKTITGVQHIAGQANAILTLSGDLTADDFTRPDTLAASNSQIFNNVDNPVSTAAVNLTTNDCPVWGTRFDFSEVAGSATTTDNTGLLVGTVGNPVFSVLGDGLYRGDETEAEATYIDLLYNKCLQSARTYTLEARYYAGDVDLDYADNDSNGYDDDYDVAGDIFGELGDGRNSTAQRIAERQGTFWFNVFRAGFANDYVGSRKGKARAQLKYRRDNASSHTCPHPQWPADNTTGTSSGLHQINADINQYPVINGHWYKIRIVFNSDKSNIAGSNGTPVDIFIDDQGEDPYSPANEFSTEIWSGYVNASATIANSSSCKWGALPGDYMRIADYYTAIGDNTGHGDVPGDKNNVMLKGKLDWFEWKPYADYDSLDDLPY
jgi:hypothetical protein